MTPELGTIKTIIREQEITGRKQRVHTGTHKFHRETGSRSSCCGRRGSAASLQGPKEKKEKRTHRGATGSVASWERWDTGLTPGPAQWVKNPALPQLQVRSRLQLRSDPYRVAKNGRKKKKEKKKRHLPKTKI